MPARAEQASAASIEAFIAGALVFGGGHIVLPLLRESVVASGWISIDEFLAGYCAAQGVTGADVRAFGVVGGEIVRVQGGLGGASVALVAIFLPGLLLVAGSLPLWRSIGHTPVAARAVAGINAAVAGVLAAALYDPVRTSAVRGPFDVAISYRVHARGGLARIGLARRAVVRSRRYCRCASIDHRDASTTRAAMLMRSPALRDLT